MYLVKVPQSTSVDVSIYHKKCKASLKNIKTIKSLRCKSKVASLHICQKIDFGVTFVLSVLRSYIFFSNTFCVIANVIVITENCLLFSGNKFTCKIHS